MPLNGISEPKTTQQTPSGHNFSSRLPESVIIWTGARSNLRRKNTVTIPQPGVAGNTTKYTNGVSSKTSQCWPASKPSLTRWLTPILRINVTLKTFPPNAEPTSLTLHPTLTSENSHFNMQPATAATQRSTP